MTTHDRDKIIAAAIGCIEGPYDRSRAITITGNEIERLYAIAFEAGRQSVDTPVALAEAYRCGEEAGRQAEREECAVIAETPVSGEQDDITMSAKDRVASAIRTRSTK